MIGIREAGLTRASRSDWEYGRILYRGVEFNMAGLYRGGFKIAV